MKLSALLAPLLDAKVDHELILAVVLEYENDKAGLIARLCPPGVRLRARQWAKVRARILTRDECSCHYCGAWADEVDHVQPIALGGSNDDANLVACCSYCNRSKGAKTIEEWRVTH